MPPPPKRPPGVRGHQRPPASPRPSQPDRLQQLGLSLVQGDFAKCGLLSPRGRRLQNVFC
eukprot:6410542-Prymnesium_polylepis.1